MGQFCPPSTSEGIELTLQEGAADLQRLCPSQPQPVCSTSASQQQPVFIAGQTIASVRDVVQWRFPADFCQPSLGGRCGSNACTFIALYFGHLYLHENLPPPHGSVPLMDWKCALYKAMKKGNEIHAELFEGGGVDVKVNNAVSMAGTKCFVNCVGQNIGLIGQDCVDQVASAFKLLSGSPGAMHL